MSTSIPITKNLVSDEREMRIRSAVRSASSIGDNTNSSRLAAMDDGKELANFLNDPKVYAPIYSLPREINLDSIKAFISRHLDERDRGEGLLFVRVDEHGRIVGYSDFQIWPQWAAGELGGALHPNLQSQGRGSAGAASSFDWMFEALDLELICATAALDNIRTARMLDRLGFERMGMVDSVREDGSTRESNVWEIMRDAWRTNSAAIT